MRKNAPFMQQPDGCACPNVRTTAPVERPTRKASPGSLAKKLAMRATDRQTRPRMSLNRKLAAWEAAGLISEAAATEIRAFEARERRPVALWAIVGLGLLALALGILLMVSANWDRIPDALKLGTHIALAAAAAGTVWWAIAQSRPWLAEAALFMLGALVLAGIALQSQVYQLVGPLWQPLLLWLALMTPAMLLVGQTRLTGHAWALLAIAGPLALAIENADGKGIWLWAHGAAMATPAVLVILSFLPRIAAAFATAVRETAIIVLLAAASIAHFGWASEVTPAEAGEMAVRFVLPVLAAVAATLLSRRRAPAYMALWPPLLVAPVLAAALALAVPHPDVWVSRFVGVLLFAAVWGWIAREAARAGWNALFAVAVAAIAIRIFVIYIELFGSLAATGGGLIAGGALLIALALVWRRLVSRRTAMP